MSHIFGQENKFRFIWLHLVASGTFRYELCGRMHSINNFPTRFLFVVVVVVLKPISFSFQFDSFWWGRFRISALKICHYTVILFWIELCRELFVKMVPNQRSIKMHVCSIYRIWNLCVLPKTAFLSAQRKKKQQPTSPKMQPKIACIGIGNCSAVIEKLVVQFCMKASFMQSGMHIANRQKKKESRRSAKEFCK